MKFRTGFVTNSSSYSSLVIHKIESKELKNILEKHGIDIELLQSDEFTETLDVDFKLEAIYTSISDTLICILDGYCGSDITIDQNVIDDILQHKSDIDASASCIIQAGDVSNELDAFYFDKDVDEDEFWDDEFWENHDLEDSGISYGEIRTLILENGKGRLVNEYYCEAVSNAVRKKCKKAMPKSSVHIIDNGVSVKTVLIKDVFLGKNFVISGELNRYSHESISLEISRLGGKVSDTVTKKTAYVITNHPNSDASELKQARELGINIISEDEYMELTHKAFKGDFQLDHPECIEL